MTRSHSLASLFTFAGLVMACGPNTPNAPFDPGLAPDRTIASLTDEEAATYCAAANDYREDHVSNQEMKRITCTLFAVAFTPDSATCERSVSGCLAAGGDFSTTSGCALDSPDRGSCSVTLADMNACTQESVLAMADVGSEITCALAGDPAALTRLSALQSETCQQIFDTCPGLDASE